MAPGTQVDVELRVRHLCEAGDYDKATTEALRAYGGELMRFLCACHKSEESAADVFSVFAEDLWRGLKGFVWECSLRTWAYTLVRRASFRTMHRKRRTVVKSPSALSGLVQEVRTETLTYLRTERKTRLRALREALPEADQALLMLRVDRGLSWDELARVLSDDEIADAEGRQREAARLRKRFQVVKERLKSLAKREGLYPRRNGDGS